MNDNVRYTRDLEFDDVWPDLRKGDQEVRRSCVSCGWILNTQPAIETISFPAIEGPVCEGSPGPSEPDCSLSGLPSPVPIVSPATYPFLDDDNSVEEIITAVSAIVPPRPGECSYG